MLHSTTITFFTIFVEVAEDVRRICGRYPPQKNARNCVTFLFPAEVQKTIFRKKKPEIASLFALLRRIPPIFPKELQKKTEKSLVSPLCKPPLLCYSATFRDFRGGTSAKPEKSPKLRCFRCGRYKKASSAKRLSKTRKKPEIAWENDCGGYAEGILRTIFRNFRRFFFAKFKRVVNYRSNTTPL